MKKKRYYLLGIGGVAMSGLAGLLRQKGYNVAGSDQAVYPPISDFLKKLAIPVFSPYSAENFLKYKPDVVVVGNAVGRTNPEVEFLLNSGLQYRSMAEVLTEEFIEGKKAIVIAGTHGKTTVTALVAWILEVAGLDPTVFIGGLAKNFDSNFKLGRGEYIVLEGDEYDAAFFDKGPKFWHYRPYVGLVNNIELDHVDIYKNIDAIKFVFDRFAKLIPSKGLLVVNKENEYSHNLIGNNPYVPAVTFGLASGDYTVRKIDFGGGRTTFEIFYKGKFLIKIATDLIGKHNISNILAAVAIGRFLKIPIRVIAKAILSFHGVKRRAEILGIKNDVTVIDDFAHHPTAVSETLAALRARFPKKRIFLIFEPSSASSKRRVFEKEYIKAFAGSDIVYLYKPIAPKNLAVKEIFSSKSIAMSLRKSGIQSKVFDNSEMLLADVAKDVKPNDIIIIMSCRGFDGVTKKIFDVL